MSGTAEKPRLLVHRTLKHLWAQVIDDTTSKVLLALSTQDKEIMQNSKTSGNIKSAEHFGAIFSLKAKEKGISSIIFDRAGYLYHGRIKAFAEALRKGGLKF